METDDDGHPKRKGNLLTAGAHIVTAVIGSGVLSLPWATAQLGWVGGAISLSVFSLITLFASFLLADCYRFPGPISGTRNYTYNFAVKAHLGPPKSKLCAVAQYTSLILVAIAYIVTASLSLAGIKEVKCRHANGGDAACKESTGKYMAIYGAVEILFSQVANFHKLTWLSSVAAVMSFGYCFIGIGLSIVKIVEVNHHSRATLTGVTVGIDVTKGQKIWNSFTALGNIACAYTFSFVLIEIQNTLRAKPSENEVMKKASLIGIVITTVIYMACGFLGYMAFGNESPGNLLTGSGFYEPFWLVDIANICIIIHLVGAYQVFSQPVFALCEEWCAARWPHSQFVTKESPFWVPFMGNIRLNGLRLVFRTVYVMVGTIIAMFFPYFNIVMGLVGAVSFWPLTLYFPIEMCIAQRKIGRWTSSWIWLKFLSMSCLLVTVMILISSMQGLVVSVRK